jgi:hypothetical protein
VEDFTFQVQGRMLGCLMALDKRGMLLQARNATLAAFAQVLMAAQHFACPFCWTQLAQWMYVCGMCVQ